MLLECISAGSLMAIDTTNFVIYNKGHAINGCATVQMKLKLRYFHYFYLIPVLIVFRYVPLISPQGTSLQVIYTVRSTFESWLIDVFLVSWSRKVRLTTVKDPLRWPRDNPISTKIGTKFCQHVAVVSQYSSLADLRPQSLFVCLFVFCFCVIVSVVTWCNLVKIHWCFRGMYASVFIGEE
jgi:hypothetical protein